MTMASDGYFFRYRDNRAERRQMGDFGHLPRVAKTLKLPSHSSTYKLRQLAITRGTPRNNVAVTA